jgi:phage replication initiation protein
MNNVLYDWLTFSTKIHSLPDVVSFLGLEGVQFQQLRGRYCYSDRLTYDGINIYYNGREDMGICVEFSGQGCRNFETVGNGDYQHIFDMINENWSADSEKRQMNISRLDVAYDDFDGLLSLTYLMQAAQKGEYVSRCKDIEVIYSNKGCSVCHGSRLQSNVYVRIYDKKMERKRDDLDHWVRCEIKLKDETAKGFISLGGDIRKNYFDVLNNYLRYVVPSDNVTNKSMLLTSSEWLNFLESWETVSIFVKPGTEYNITKLDGFINHQLSGALTTYINIVGVDKFVENISEAQKGKVLNPKYKALSAKCGTAADNIKEFLAERGL